MREIKFRAWDKKRKKFVTDFQLTSDGKILTKSGLGYAGVFGVNLNLMQFTGLKDKNGTGQEVYESDIIDKDGNIIGNEYETPALLKDTANLLIQGFGTENWQKA